MKRLDIDDRLRELHGQGWSDRMIAEDLGCSVTSVWRHRGEMGLPRLGWTEVKRERRQQVYRRAVCAANGATSLAGLRAVHARVRVGRLGFDSGRFCTAEARIILLLVDGPATSADMKQALGITTLHNYRRPGGQYTASLLRAGVIRMERRGQQRVYHLCEGVLAGITNSGAGRSLYLRTVAEKFEAGWSDERIARFWGLEPWTITLARQHMGLYLEDQESYREDAAG